MSFTLTRKQYAHLVRDIEKTLKTMRQAATDLLQVAKGASKLKGSGPDDYGAPNTLETYLAAHPMSEMEFWVDHGGVPMGGAGLGKKLKSKMKKIKFRELAKRVFKKLKDPKKALEEVKEKAEEKADEFIDNHLPEGAKGKANEMKDAAIKIAHESAEGAVDTAVKKAEEVKKELRGEGCGCKGGGGDRGNAFAGEREHDHEKREKDERRGLRGRGHKMHGGARPGEDGSYDGAGLLLNQLGFVRALVPTEGMGGVAVPFNNHLQNEPVSGPGGRIPAGGYGDYALPVAGGGWDSGY